MSLGTVAPNRGIFPEKRKSRTMRRDTTKRSRRCATRPEPLDNDKE